MPNTTVIWRKERNEKLRSGTRQKGTGQYRKEMRLVKKQQHRDRLREEMKKHGRE